MKKINRIQEVVEHISDSHPAHWVYRLLPSSLQPYAQLARWDRPIGWHLLFWPCGWSAALAFTTLRTGHGFSWQVFFTYLFFFVAGAIFARGAGCTYNDLIDEPVDKQVWRTRLRPLPSGKIIRSRAWFFLFLQTGMAALILFQFNMFTIFVVLAFVPIVIFYPFAKRIGHWYPQCVLGLVFSSGALVGWSAVFGKIGLPSFLLYCGSILWVIAYDTIYAHQDKEDDALLGMHSTARLFGEKTKFRISFLYGFSFLFLLLAFISARAPFPAFMPLACAGMHMIGQIYRLNIHNPEQCLKIFKSNSVFGFLVFTGLLLGLMST